MTGAHGKDDPVAPDARNVATSVAANPHRGGRIAGTAERHMRSSQYG